MALYPHVMGLNRGVMHFTRAFARSFSTSQARRAQNHYEVLGVSVNATPDEIKKRFFELSKQYHPDRNTAAEPERYQEITQAYTVLSNEEERRKFDQSLGSAVRKPEGYHSGRAWESGSTRKRPGASGYNYNAASRWQAAHAHRARHSSKLDPLKPQNQSREVPHFDFDTHLRGQQRQERYQRMKREQQQRQEHATKSAATASMGDGAPSDPHKEGTSFLVKAAGATAAGLSLLYLLLR